MKFDIDQLVSLFVINSILFHLICSFTNILLSFLQLLVHFAKEKNRQDTNNNKYQQLQKNPTLLILEPLIWFSLSSLLSFFLV